MSRPGDRTDPVDQRGGSTFGSGGRYPLPMKSFLPSLLAIAAVVPAVVAATVPTATQSAVEVGDEVAYTFRAAPLNAMGITGLDELRGKPVLVEFWGTR